MEQVSKDEFAGRCQIDDERFMRDKERLDKLEAKMETVADLSIRIGLLIEKSDKRAEDHECRISAIESRPAKWFDYIISAGIGAMIAAVISNAMNAI